MMKKLKVLMVGPERTAKGGIASVINQYFSNDLDKTIELNYLETACEGNKVRKILFFIRAFLKFFLIVFKYDIVHIHMASRGSYNRKRLFVLIAKKLFGKKIFIHLHGAEFKEFFYNECTAKKKNKIRKTFYSATAIIALSEQWKDFILEIVPFARVEIIHNAVHVSERIEDYSNHNVLFLGRIGERKGIYNVLSVWPSVIKKYTNAQLYIAGDGNIEECKSLCKKLDVENSVKILGWLDKENCKNLFYQCSIFILPSYNEGLPMSMLEAMSCGLAVVVSPVGGIPTVVKHGINGMLVEAGNEVMIKSEIVNLLEDEELKRRIGINAWNTIKQEYSIDGHIKKLLALYFSV